MKEQEKHDWLEDFVQQNLQELNSREPAEAVWESIRLRPKPARKLYTRWAAAAAVALLVGLAWFKPWQSNSAGLTAESSLKNAPAENRQQRRLAAIPELMEAEAYYGLQVEQKFAELRALPAWRPDLEAELEYDLAGLDSAYIELKEDLHEDLANEAIIEAMIQNYRLKVKVLEDILLYLQEPEQPTTDHGNEELI